jgi:hypothetical protein
MKKKNFKRRLSNFDNLEHAIHIETKKLCLYVLLPTFSTIIVAVIKVVGVEIAVSIFICMCMCEAKIKYYSKSFFSLNKIFIIFIRKK